ncbi:unnamed protein product [Closterium sp. NIES-53]
MHQPPPTEAAPYASLSAPLPEFIHGKTEVEPWLDLVDTTMTLANVRLEARVTAATRALDEVAHRAVYGAKKKAQGPFEWPEFSTALKEAFMVKKSDLELRRRLKSTKCRDRSVQQYAAEFKVAACMLQKPLSDEEMMHTFMKGLPVKLQQAHVTERAVGHPIPLEPGKLPPFIPLYCLSRAEYVEAKEQIEEYLRKRWIEPSVSPYGVPILFVNKKCGGLCMCVDYRALNKITVNNRYPLPQIEDLLDKFVLVYLDDILVYSKTEEECTRHLKWVLGKLRKHKFYARLWKCYFYRRDFEYLGHLVGNDGLKVDPKKVVAVQNWPVPKDVGQIRSFLGLANYFRRCLQNYYTIVAPLMALTHKSSAWQWTQQCQNAFDEVKRMLTNAPTKPYEVVTDASLIGIEAVLLQKGGPVAFES